jgi:ABC-type sugar transport system ATPase subunit
MIELHNVSVRPEAGTLSDVTLSVPTGQYAIVMGASGSGKTTLLETLAGLRPVQRGQIRLYGRDCTHAPPGQRGIGYVPQEAALFPTMTVRQNLGFALQIRGQPTAERVRHLADELGVSAKLDRYPAQLSGGERQRVALGRALAHKPAVLLLDEPLAALDATTHGRILSWLRQLKEQRTTTIVQVTHQVREAEQLADVCWRMEQGRVGPNEKQPPD